MSVPVAVVVLALLLFLVVVAVVRLGPATVIAGLDLEGDGGCGGGRAGGVGF